jgi:hypothetical protein
MCCSDPPPAPDLSGYAGASEDLANSLAQGYEDQLAWVREQDAANREILQQVLGVQLPAMQEQFSNAQEDRQRYEDVFRPLEDQFVQEAQGYDTPARREQERARAMADVNTQFDAQRRNATQRLESYGVDPSMTRNAALDIGVRTAQAAAAAAAGTGAERYVEDKGRELRGQAINMGRGLMPNIAAGYAGATGTGGAAVNAANQTTGTGAAAATSALGFSGQALQGYGNAAGIMTQNFENQMAQYDAEQAQSAGMLQGIGNIAGMAFGIPPRPKPTGNADGGMAIPLDDGLINTGIGDGSGIDDAITARVSDGEYIIPADVVRIKGQEFFDKLVQKYHTPAAQQRGAV